MRIPDRKELMRRLLPMACAAAALVALAAAAAERHPASLDQGSEIAYRRALTAEAQNKTLNADVQVTRRARRIVNRLVNAVPASVPASQSFHWQVNVRTDPAADVRAYPGGRLLLSDGLFTRTGMKDDEVAAIVAHAIAHLVLGHDVAQLAAAANAPAPSPDPNREALAWSEAIAGAIRAPRYGAAEVAAADRMSAELVAQAAYDPRALMSAWRQLARLDSGKVRAAPITETRLVAIDDAARAAIPLYEAALARATAAPPPARAPSGTMPRAGGPPAR